MTPARQERRNCLFARWTWQAAQGALSWELRSATSLARVWHSQGRGDDARAVLTRVCDRFAEGFDTQDMRRAVTLLESVGGNRGTTRRRVAVSGIGSC